MSASDRSDAGIPRRKFLYLSSAAALGVGFGGVARAAEGLAAPAAAGPRAMSVGFVEGSETWGTIDKSTPLAGLRVVPARELLLGEQQMALEQLKVTVHGLYPKQLGDKGLIAANLAAFTVLFPNPDETLHDGPLPFHAWEYRKKPAPMPAARLHFELPTGTYGDVDFVLDVTETRQGRQVAQRYQTRFTVDAIAGMPKLQRGFYLLGFGADTWDTTVTLPAAGKKLRPELASLVVAFDMAQTMLS